MRLSERDVLHAALPASGPGEDPSADPTERRPARVSPHTGRGSVWLDEHYMNCLLCLRSGRVGMVSVFVSVLRTEKVLGLWRGVSPVSIWYEASVMFLFVW